MKLNIKKPNAKQEKPVIGKNPLELNKGDTLKNSPEHAAMEANNNTHVIAINKQTLEPKLIRLPNVEEQPQMLAIKKPVSGETATSSLATKPNPFAKSKQAVSGEHTPNKLQADSCDLANGQNSLNLPPLIGALNMKNHKNNLQANLKPPVSKPSQTLLQKPLTSQNSTGDSHKLAIKKKASAPKKLSLYGTGLTKNLLGKSEKLLSKAEVPKTDSASKPSEPSAILYEHALPDTLMAANLVLDEFQAPAVAGLAKQKYGCLIGAAGTGKTTVLKAIVASIEDSVIRLAHKDLTTYKETHTQFDGTVPAIAFCAFMGKAVQQMKRALPKSYHPLTNTIHATLGYAPVEEEYMDKETHEWKTHKVFRPSYTKDNKLPYRFIIIDEGGTVPVHLWHELYDACPEDCRILILGDLNQLPPVSGHSILGFAMLKWQTYVLEKLHRQAEGDPIAENAHRILAGKKPLTDKVTMKFVVKSITDGSSGARKDILGTIRHLHRQGVFDPMLDALIVPQNIGNLGQIELNNTLVNYFNPSLRDSEGAILNKRHIIKAGYAHVIFAVGDKVMLTANDTQRMLTNGMVGVVTEIIDNSQYGGERSAANAEIDLGTLDLQDLDFAKAIEEDDDVPETERAASHTMIVKLQNVDKPVEFSTAGSFKKIVLAYAMTCHKAQGSEYRNVVVVAHASNTKMLTREWLYTAITRAQERVILLCNHRGLTHAVNSQSIRGNTIAEKAKKFLAMQGKTASGEVRLPEPEAIRSLTMTRES